MKQPCIIVTREGRIRLKRLQLEHGLLHDKPEKKSYAVIKDAYPTNKQGGWARTYLIHETAAQTIEVDGESVKIHGGTVEVREPLNTVARIRMPGPRGEDGEVRDVHLTAEAIYDRTLSAQVRRLGNRRFQWFHALLFVALGVTIGLFLAGAIALMSGGESPEAAEAPRIVVPSGGGTGSNPGHTPPEIVVGTSQEPAQPTLEPTG